MAALALGTVQFGLDYGISNTRGRVSREEAAAILRRARRAGIQVLDTAAAYGEAEAVLGTLLRDDAGFRIVTKTARLAEGLDTVIARARRSVDLLGTPLDAILVHSAGDLAGAAGDRLWQALCGLRDEGLFRKIGISAYAEETPLALAARFAPDLMQVPLSVLDQRLLEDGSLAALKARGIEVHVRSIFLQGLVFVDPERLPASLAHGAPALRRVLEAIAAQGATPLEAAVSFAMAWPDVDRVVVGVTSEAELDAIVDASRLPLALDWRACALDDPILLSPARW